MKRSFVFSIVLVVLLLSVVSALWPFTGFATGGSYQMQVEHYLRETGRSFEDVLGDKEMVEIEVVNHDGYNDWGVRPSGKDNTVYSPMLVVDKDPDFRKIYPDKCVGKGESISIDGVSVVVYPRIEQKVVRMDRYDFTGLGRVRYTSTQLGSGFCVAQDARVTLRGSGESRGETRDVRIGRWVSLWTGGQKIKVKDVLSGGENGAYYCKDKDKGYDLSRASYVAVPASSFSFNDDGDGIFEQVGKGYYDPVFEKPFCYKIGDVVYLVDMCYNGWAVSATGESPLQQGIVERHCLPVGNAIDSGSVKLGRFFVSGGFSEGLGVYAGHCELGTISLPGGKKVPAGKWLAGAASGGTSSGGTTGSQQTPLCTSFTTAESCTAASSASVEASRRSTVFGCGTTVNGKAISCGCYWGADTEGVQKCRVGPRGVETVWGWYRVSENGNCGEKAGSAVVFDSLTKGCSCTSGYSAVAREERYTLCVKQ